MCASNTSLTLAKQLIEKRSLTPEDAGCQALIGNHLKALGFKLKSMPFGDVQNLWATRGEGAPVFVFAGHTDVVPVGDEQAWKTKPFVATEKEGFLYGRGIADMKGAIAAMVGACEKWIQNTPDHAGTIAFLLTSDEEGPAVNGTVKVVEKLMQTDLKIDYCLLGEPSSFQTPGDTIKIGARGSLSGFLTLYGKQGHVGFPQLAENAIHLFSPVLEQLLATKWDDGDDHFPPTQLQLTNVQAGSGATNQIPGTLTCDFNFRFSPQSQPERLQASVEDILNKTGFKHKIEWKQFGKPFISPQGTLLSSAQDAIETINGINAEISTAGGTSDARFIAQMGCEFMELGLSYQTIHAVNECVKINDLVNLSDIYYQILATLLRK